MWNRSIGKQRRHGETLYLREPRVATHRPPPVMRPSLLPHKIRITTALGFLLIIFETLSTVHHLDFLGYISVQFGLYDDHKAAIWSPDTSGTTVCPTDHLRDRKEHFTAKKRLGGGGWGKNEQNGKRQKKRGKKTKKKNVSKAMGSSQSFLFGIYLLCSLCSSKSTCSAQSLGAFAWTSADPVHFWYEPMGFKQLGQLSRRCFSLLLMQHSIVGVMT